MAENGCVIFAKDVDAMSAFYRSVLGMTSLETSDSHCVLSNGSIELVVHAMPKAIADTITISTPPELRVAIAMKPAFVVESLEKVRAACEKTNGGLHPESDVWDIRGAKVIDGWDPEGNIIQFKQVVD